MESAWCVRRARGWLPAASKLKEVGEIWRDMCRHWFFPTRHTRENTTFYDFVPSWHQAIIALVLPLHSSKFDRPYVKCFARRAHIWTEAIPCSVSLQEYGAHSTIDFSSHLQIRVVLSLHAGCSRAYERPTRRPTGEERTNMDRAFSRNGLALISISPSATKQEKETDPILFPHLVL